MMMMIYVSYLKDMSPRLWIGHKNAFDVTRACRKRRLKWVGKKKTLTENLPQRASDPPGEQPAMESNRRINHTTESSSVSDLAHRVEDRYFDYGQTNPQGLKVT